MMQLGKGILITVVIYMAYCSCVWGQSRPARVVSGRRWLRATFGYRMCASLLAFGSVFVVYAACHAAASQRWWALLVASAFVLGGGYLLYQAWLTHVGYDDQHIEYRTPMHPQQQMLWAEVVAADVHGSHIQVLSRSGQVMRFHVYREGMDDFVCVLTAHLQHPHHV